MRLELITLLLTVGDAGQNGFEWTTMAIVHRRLKNVALRLSASQAPSRLLVNAAKAQAGRAPTQFLIEQRFTASHVIHIGARRSG